MALPEKTRRLIVSLEWPLSTPSISARSPCVKLGMNEVTLWADRPCGKKKNTVNAG